MVRRDGLRPRWPSRGPGAEPAGWVGRQISQQPGLGGKSGSSLQTRCFLAEDGAEVISCNGAEAMQSGES